MAHKIPEDDEAKQRLLLLLRLFVNKLRKGHLIRTQLVRQLRYALQSNAWVGVDERGRWTQEDASELFMFLTQTFDMPYLPVKIPPPDPSFDDSIFIMFDNSFNGDYSMEQNVIKKMIA